MLFGVLKGECQMGTGHNCSLYPYDEKKKAKKMSSRSMAEKAEPTAD